jgi:phosphoinositide-3-kinase regulatory subunit 4
MGAQQSSTALPENELPPISERLSSHSILKQYRLEEVLYPTSGRLMKSFRLRHRDTESTAILKTCWVLLTNNNENDDILVQQKEELQRIQKSLKGSPYIAPFLAYWSHHEASRPCRTGGFWTPVYLLRPHFYTTLSDRLTCRPWLHSVEKLWIAQQLLQALQHLHDAGVVHGCITTENCVLSATGWLMLTDMGSYKSWTNLPDDDPSEFVYYFQPTDDARGTRCYLAPERFRSKSTHPVSEDGKEGPEIAERSLKGSSLTPRMDIFSAGCVLTEIFLNGEACLTLGDLMEYRSNGSMTMTLQQKINKIERPGIRAACKHMLALNPNDRLSSAAAYLDRLAASEPFPKAFKLLHPLVEKITTRTSTPDARLALAAQLYEEIFWEAVGVRDGETQMYLSKVLGLTTASKETAKSGDHFQKQHARTKLVLSDLVWDDSSTLFEQLEKLQIKDDPLIECSSDNNLSPGKNTDPEERTDLSKNSILIYLQIITATVRHVQRPASKLVALKMLKCLAEFSSDEARLQRIIPVAISLLQDQDALVRAMSIQVLTSSLAMIKSFPPSDSQIFPQYIFKRVAHLISDPSLVARLSFAQCIARLAETAQRFLDISHAVRLYEAVSSGTKSTEDSVRLSQNQEAVFDDEVHKLLCDDPRTSSRRSLIDTHEEADGTETVSDTTAGKTLISNSYSTDLSNLQETVSRWVVQLTTDQSSQSSLSKRAILHELGRLCDFFGLEGVTAFILPQILAFLNEKKDWELRQALFDHLPSVCCVIGCAGTEEFVLPCVEIGLVDAEERVISSALCCLCDLVRAGLLTRGTILGVGTVRDEAQNDFPCLLDKYGVLLLHPSREIRSSAIKAFSAMCEILGPLDTDVFVIPILGRFFRSTPSARALCTIAGMDLSLDTPWSREIFVNELKFVTQTSSNASQTPGTWTSVGISSDNVKLVMDMQNEKTRFTTTGIEKKDPQKERFHEYMRMLLKHTTVSNVQDRFMSDNPSTLGIEGSVKLAQNVMFPKQNGRDQRIVPEWYSSLRDQIAESQCDVSADSAIRSVSSLGDVFGLSIMGPLDGTSERVVNASTEQQAKMVTIANVHGKESKVVEAAFRGRWGAEVTLRPDNLDTCLLVTKLKAMQVPPLPPKLGGAADVGQRIMGKIGASKFWKPKMNAMVATSTIATGHQGPVVRLAVSADQGFFVSASHDGTCRVWETAQIEDSPGILESCAIYAGHKNPARINDIAMLEGTHSVVSGASDGSLHIWRADMIPASKSNSYQQDQRMDSRVVGATNIKEVDKREGEVMCVSHFSSSSASLVTYATQKGIIHSLDLRDTREPFTLHHGGEIGNLTSLALGSDRNWLVSGSSRGFVALWDIRYQQPVKVWRHSCGSAISRLATSYILTQQQGLSSEGSISARPFIFVAAGSNECGMFDVLNDECRGCFRVISANEGEDHNGHLDDPPFLERVKLRSRNGVFVIRSSESINWPNTLPCSRAINCMVGSIGAGDQSYLLTGGSDGFIRFWDFGVPSKCSVISGQTSAPIRPSYERVDFEGNRRLMVCRQSSVGIHGIKPIPSKLFRGLKRPEHYHSDAVQDLKIIEANSLISCSRDCTVKVWR